MLNKKLKKLMRNPGLFFSDMLAKKRKKVSGLYSKKVDGNYEYTVVSAVYNVGRYLDDYFKSLVNQKLNFKKNIYLIMVDDGSVDDSAAIIKKWQSKYPDNILYLRKENGGQASARNLGLEHVKTEWVTFIDPDDFVDVNYFYEVDSFVSAGNDQYCMVSCNVVFYHDNNKSIKDSHPLNFKYSKGNVSLNVNNLNKHIQLFCNSAFFKTKNINNYGLKYNSEIKPNFEDGKFVADYLMYQQAGKVAFVSTATYFYRKRSDGTSTLDLSWDQVGQFTMVTRNGYLALLKEYYDKFGYVPIFIQNTILYLVIWHLKRLINHAERVSFLSNEEKNEYIQNIFSVFKFIDSDVINRFDLAGCWFYQKMGMLSCFKELNPEFQIVYVERYDKYKNMVQLKYFCRGEGFEDIQLDGVSVLPAYTKTVSHDFLGFEFILERRLWINVGEAKELLIKISDVPTRISLSGKHYTTPVNMIDVVSCFQNNIPFYGSQSKYLSSWVFLDRDSQADDNAEHLYRYVMNNHPGKSIFFVLRVGSHDWDRLKREGFNLLEYGSDEHVNALKSCRKVISSHIDLYVANYLGNDMLKGRHCIFLQHGVTKDDLSTWLNNKDNIDCLVTVSPYEYNSIVNDGSRYIYNEKEVVLTGFPRHDSLIKFNDTEKLILVMPTWRKNIVGDAVTLGNERAYNPNFMQTEFALHWYSFIHSEKLKELVECYQYKVVFFPHANIQPYLQNFEVPEYIEIITHQDGSIQNLFGKAAMMITDYSSVAFEMAVINKPTLYYQFDEADFFSGGHAYTKGYFDYREHGFGDVATTEEALLSSLEVLLKNDAKPDAIIQSRIDATFPYRDGHCCQRVYDEIIKLDAPMPDDYVDDNILRDYAIQSLNAHQITLSERWWEQYISRNTNVSLSDNLLYVTVLRESGKLNTAAKYLEMLFSSCGDNVDSSLYLSRALLMLAMQEWSSAINFFRISGVKSVSDNYYHYLFCFLHSSEYKALPTESMLTPGNGLLLSAFSLLSHCQYREAIELLNSVPVDESDEYYRLLVLSDAYAGLKNYQEAMGCINKAECLRGVDIFVIYKKIGLLYELQEWETVCEQFSTIAHDIASLPIVYVFYYVAALCQLDQKDVAREQFERLKPDHYDESNEYFYSKICMLLDKWDLAVSYLSKNNLANSQAVEDLSNALRFSGQLMPALLNLKTKEETLEPSGWALRAELAQLNDDWEDAYQSWRRYLSLAPLQVTTEAMTKLQDLKKLSELVNVNRY